jgi:hypothetical protein
MPYNSDIFTIRLPLALGLEIRKEAENRKVSNSKIILERIYRSFDMKELKMSNEMRIAAVKVLDEWLTMSNDEFWKMMEEYRCK